MKTTKQSTSKNYFISLFIFFLFISGNVFSQDKYTQKLEKQFNKANYEKCIELSIKYQKKAPKNSNIYLYKAFAYYEMYKQSERQRDSIKYMRKVLLSLDKVSKYNSNNVYVLKYKDDVEVIHNEILSFSENLYQSNKEKSRFFYNRLAKVFMDTTSQYLAFNQVHVKENNTNIVETPTNVFIDQTISAERIDMLKKATGLIGVKYLYGGEKPTGFDCSGFTKYTYSQIGLNIPHNAQLQSKLGEKVTLKNAKPGDLIFFGSRNGDSYHAVHAGIVYANNDGKLDIIHCVSGGVHISPAGCEDNKYWLGRTLFVKRVIGTDAVAALQVKSN